jgi:hypothetical protein
MRCLRCATPLIGLSALLASSAFAQRAPATRLPTPRMCSMLFSVLIVQLVDSAHTPVPGATVTVRRVRTGALIESAGPGDDGSYKILEDGVLKDLRRNGEAFDATFTKGARRRTVRLRIGMDEDRCHVRFITAPRAIVF